MKLKKNQRGVYMVEFAIIAAVMFTVLFAAIELSRMIWVWNTLDEATRRGARLAAVCPINDSSIPEVTVFNSPGGGANSPILNNLTTASVNVNYLESDGLTPSTTFEDVRFVRVSINCGTCTKFKFKPLIPFFSTAGFDLPAFETTLPSESLGYAPDSSPPVFSCP